MDHFLISPKVLYAIYRWPLEPSVIAKFGTQVQVLRDVGVVAVDTHGKSTGRVQVQDDGQVLYFTALCCTTFSIDLRVAICKLLQKAFHHQVYRVSTVMTELVSLTITNLLCFS